MSEEPHKEHNMRIIITCQDENERQALLMLEANDQEWLGYDKEDDSLEDPEVFEPDTLLSLDLISNAWMFRYANEEDEEPAPRRSLTLLEEINQRLKGISLPKTSPPPPSPPWPASENTMKATKKEPPSRFLWFIIGAVWGIFLPTIYQHLLDHHWYLSNWQ